MIPSRNAGTEAELYALYARFAEANPGLAYVYLGSADGGYVQWPEGNIGAGYDPRERPFYQAALSQPGEVVRTEADYIRFRRCHHHQLRTHRGRRSWPGDRGARG
tara:strand:- start:511 stop:825 length:315 start_codon:yes stop_codon:yes gene_type:complete